MFSSVSSKPSHWPNVGEPTPQVHDDVVDRAARAAHELRRAVADLEVHAAHDPVARAGVVVLHHLLGDPELGEHRSAVGLAEEAALVAEDARRDQNRAVQLGRESVPSCSCLQSISDAGGRQPGPLHVVVSASSHGLQHRQTERVRPRTGQDAVQRPVDAAGRRSRC